MRPLVIAPGIVLSEDELVWTSVRSSGPGGQNVNKVASKVELRFDLARTRALGEATKRRLAVMARGRLDAEGRIVIVSQRSRDRERNLEDARAKLRELLVRALRPEKKRRPTAPTPSSRRRRVVEKRAHGEKKRERRVSPETDG